MHLAQFFVSQYNGNEGGWQVVHFSADILYRCETPPLNGCIEVDITVEDLPSHDPDILLNLANEVLALYHCAFIIPYFYTYKTRIPINYEF